MSFSVKIFALFFTATILFIISGAEDTTQPDSKNDDGFLASFGQTISSTFQTVVNKTKEGYSKAKDVVVDAYDAVKTKAKEAYDDHQKKDENISK